VSAPRVLHVITGLRTGGAEMMLLKLASSTADRALVVSLTGEGPMGERMREAGVEVRSLGMRPGTPDLRAVPRLIRIIREWRPDLVQTWMYHADLLGGIAGRLAGVPVVWNIRQSTLDRSTSKLHTRATLAICARLSHRLPARIVSCSRAGSNLHADLGYDGSRIVLIPNGFDVEHFRPDAVAREEVRRELGVPPSAPLIGLVARFDPQKDHRSFLAAAAILGERWPEARFLLCGDGLTAGNAEVRGWIRDHRLEDRVLLLGRRPDVNRVMAALDVATSASYQEGFPNVIGEAMATGLPCVVTDAGDSGSIVGSAGIVVPVRDPEALARGWDEVLSLEPAARSRLGEAARQRVVDRFSLRTSVSRYEALYTQISADRTAGSRP
jgi:glycosyltransferase involved in cell wall biosynthesis